MGELLGPIPRVDRVSVDERARARCVATDRAGVIASTLCAVHCGLSAILVSVAGAWRFFADERLEAIFVVVSVTIAVTSTALGFRRHRQKAPVALLAVAATMIAAARIFGVAEVAFSVVGSMALVSMHVVKLRALRRVRDCC